MTFLGLHASDAPALVDAASGEVLSYRDLVARAYRVADVLGARKSLVFLLCRNDVPTAIMYAGTMIGRHATALLDGSREVHEHASLMLGYRPRWVAGPAGTSAALEAVAVPIDSVTSLEGLEVIRLGATQRPAIHPDLSVLLATSGTTGSSKYVRLSTRNIESNAVAIADYLALTPRERAVSSLPLHYSFGLSVLNSHWKAGASMCMTSDSVIQQTLWDSVRNLGCTSIAGVPYTYQMLERVGFRAMDLPSIRTMQQAGGRLDPRLSQIYHDHMTERGGRFFVMYGQTEATARIAYVPTDRFLDKPGSAGVAIPGGQLSVDTTARMTNEGRNVGEVVYQGPNVMMGYAEDAADVALGDVLNGTLRTGDIGYLDDEGFLFLTGRSKRIAKVFGLRVNLDEVEAMLRERGPAAVVAVEERLWGFCAFGTDATLREQGLALSRRLHLHRSTVKLVHVEEIPTSSSGKVDYRQVERWAQS